MKGTLGKLFLAACLTIASITLEADNGLVPVPREFCPDADLTSIIGLESRWEARDGMCDDPDSTGANPILSDVAKFGEDGCCIYRVVIKLQAQVPKFHNNNGEEIYIRVAGKKVWSVDETQVQPGNQCQMITINKRVVVDLVAGENVAVELHLNNTYSNTAFARIRHASVLDTYINPGVGTCHGDCNINAGIANNSVSFNLAFGTPSITSTNLGVAGNIRLTEFEPSVRLCSASQLQYLSKGDGAEVIYDPNNEHCLRQVKGLDGLADVVTIDQYKYDIRLYKPANVLSKVGGVYQTQNSPEVTYTICNPNETQSNLNHLWILESRPSMTTKTNKFEWSATNEAWTLTRPDAEVGQRRVTTWNTAGDERTEVLEKYNLTTLEVHYKSLSKYKLFDVWDDNGDRAEAIIERTIGTGTNALVSTYDYYSSTNDNGYMRLKEAHYSGGNWEYNFYDSSHRLLTRYSAYGTNDWNTAYIGGASVVDTNLCRTLSQDYSLLSGAGDNGSRTNAPRTTIEYVLGKEVGRSYLVVKDGEERFIRAQTPGAAWNNSSNLVTIKKYFTSGTFSNALQSVEYPDGTMTIYDYISNWNYRTNTVWHGEPNAGKTAIVNGTKDVTVYLGGASGSNEGAKTIESSYDIASGIKTDETVYNAWDWYKRPTSITFMDGRTESRQYGCCGLESVSGSDGSYTSFVYDSLGRQINESVNSVGTSTYYDSAGNVTHRTRTGRNTGSPIIIPGTTIDLGWMGYDLAGRMTSHTNALSGVTTSLQSFASNGASILTQNNPDGGTKIDTYCVDGRLEKMTGTATQPVRYDYGVEQLEGVWREYTKTIALDGNGADTSQWTKSYTDMVGRTIRTVYAAASTPYPYAQSIYNVQGQLVKQIDPDGVQTLYVYNDEGEVEYTVQDQDQDGVMDLAGNDRIQRSERDAVVYASTDTMRTRTYAYRSDGSATETLVSTQHRSTDGLKSWQTIYRDASTPVTTQTVLEFPTHYQNQNGEWISKTETVHYPDGTQDFKEYSKSGVLVLSQKKDTLGNVLTETAFEHDDHWRTIKSIDKRNGATTYTYNDADLVTSVSTPTTPPLVTTTFYDGSLRATATDLPDGSTAYQDYYETGQLEKNYGGPNYPVEYTYDAQGRMRTMKTWQDYAGDTGTATTRWNYDAYRGWLKSKDYPNETTGVPPGTEGSGGPTYTYTDGGRLKTRVWKRGVTTTYGYNNLGDLSSVSYSDTTPSLTYTYHRYGPMKTSLKNGMTTTVNHNLAGLPTSELYTGGTLNGHGMNYTYDTLLRQTNAQTKIGSDTVDALSAYHSTTGRLDEITHSDTLSGGTLKTYDIAYGYETDSNLINQIDYGVSSKLNTTRVYDVMNRATSIFNQASATALSDTSNYQYNALSQRTLKTEADGSYWDYQYDDLGQVISGKKYWADDSLVDGQDFEYAFDDIGNRTTTGGRVSAVSTYDANYLNQYDDRTVAGKIDVIGVANPTASVTVNSNTATRKGEYFHHALSVSNSSGPVDQSVSVTSNYGSTQTVNENTYVAKATEVYTYDADGNLLSDGHWDYTWDGENRLIEMETIAAAPSSAEQRLEFEYDYKGRRIRKKIYEPDGMGGETLVLDRKYVYDQWNLQAETDGNLVLLRKYLWGPDLSGSPQGAGGVGGLLMICDVPSVGNKDYYFVGADANGNVTVLVDADTGTIEGRYAYGPFGEPLRATGSAIAGKNPFRFSTKYTDGESGFLYYGFRYYNPETGRWLSRDPIQERGGANLFGILDNNPVNYFDKLGLAVLLFEYETKIEVATITYLGRTFNGGVKTRHTIEVDTDTRAITKDTKYIGNTIEYDNTGLIIGRATASGFSLQAGVVSRSVSPISRVPKCSFTVWMKGDEGHPLVFGAPGITYYVRISVNTQTRKMKWRGEHDRFPSHRFSVDGKSVHSFSHVAAGTTPASLFPSARNSTFNGTSSF